MPRSKSERGDKRGWGGREEEEEEGREMQIMRGRNRQLEGKVSGKRKQIGEKVVARLRGTMGEFNDGRAGTEKGTRSQ